MKALLLGGALALVAAAPAHAAIEVVHAQDTLTWDRPTVPVVTGDTVTWTFAGTTQAHNVESAGGDWALTSPVALVPPDVSYEFKTPGTYHFRCLVHPDTMVGDVVVSDVAQPPPPPPPPPPLSAQPFANDSAPLATVETGGLDRTRPALRSVRLRRTAGGARVSLRVSEPARVTVTFRRGGKLIKRLHADATGAVALEARLRAGRYRVELRAIDLAGNRSARVMRSLVTATSSSGRAAGR